MSGASRAGCAVFAGFLGLGPAPPTDLRTDLEALGLALDRAVQQVSRPSRMVAPRSPARGYRLEGFGAMFVLAPRALPVPPPTPTPEEREIARALSEAARELERRLPQVASDDMRLQLQQSLKAMRQMEEEIRLREKMGRRAAGEPVPVTGAAVARPRTLEETLQDLERDVQLQIRLQADQGTTIGLPPEVAREIEAHMRLVNEQAAAFAAEAERARQQAEQIIRNQLGQPSPAAPVESPASPTAQLTLPPESGAPAILPPWRLWIDPMEDPTPDPEGVIEGVGSAVMAVLEAHGSRLTILAPQEVVAVAVDFVPATRMGARARPARTLMVRARKADIDQRAAGAISADEFRKRVELVEY